MLRRSVIILSLLFAGAASAQEVGSAPAFSQKAEPAVHALVAPALDAPARRFTLPAPDAEEFAVMRANNARQKRLQIGFGRSLPAGLASLSLDGLAWQTLAVGSRVARVEIESPGAAALRAAVDARALPKGMEVRAYAPGEPRVAHEPLRSGHKASLAEQRGDVIGLELFAPAGVETRGAQLSLTGLTHLAVHPLSWDRKHVSDIGASGACNIDVACHPDPEWYEVGKGVAKYVFTDENDDGYLCTGTLLNNLAQDGTPLFTTAEHCIGSQAYASTMVFYWHFDRATCGGAVPTGGYVSANTTTGGAQLLAIAAPNDMVLLSLNQDPAPDTLLIGWDANEPVQGAAVVGIHHPSGDLKKYAGGTVTDFTQYSSDTHSAKGTHLRVEWSEATTEGGSSGSGLFNDSYQLIGTLEGGGASCSALGEPDWYGRLDQAFEKFEPWLVDGAGAGPPADEVVTPVVDGETVHADLDHGEWHYYSITLPSAALGRLDAYLTVFEGDADLYIREGELPLATHYGCRSWQSGTSDESCSVTDSTPPGTWYIGVYAYDGPVSYALEVELADTTAPPPPPPADSGGGGYGAWLWVMVAFAWGRYRRRAWTTRSNFFASPSGRR